MRINLNDKLFESIKEQSKKFDVKAISLIEMILNAYMDGLKDKPKK